MEIMQHLRCWKTTYTLLLLLVILATCGRHLAYAQHPRLAKPQADRIVICDDLDPTKRPCNIGDSCYDSKTDKWMYCANSEPVIPYFKGDADAFVEWWVAEHGLEHSDMKAALAAAAELGYRTGFRDRGKLLLDNRAKVR